MSTSPWWQQWDPQNVTVVSDGDEPGDAWKTCVIQGVYFGENGYNGNLGGRISAIFVIFATALIATGFPVVARELNSRSSSNRWRVPEIVYTICKQFGSGVIITTAFIHLMDPAYSEIGGQSCVGMTGNWSIYSWCPAIMLATATFTFIVDAYCDFFADVWFNTHSHAFPTRAAAAVSAAAEAEDNDNSGLVHVHSHGSHSSAQSGLGKKEGVEEETSSSEEWKVEEATDFYSQIAGFLVLEFGVLFHSVMIGLTLGSSEEYKTLYPVLVFHQSFEGLGIGSRLSAIPFPKGKRWWPYAFIIAYALTTPIAIAIGIGVRTSYRDSSYTALVVSGILDAMSAGILLYTGFVELLARDFIFNPSRTKNIWMLNLQLFVFLWGAGLMALLGKWA